MGTRGGSRGRKGMVVVLLLSVVLAFFALDGHRYLTLEGLKERQLEFVEYYAAHRATTLLGFGALYVAVTAASLPGATVLTLLAGALFGVAMGTLVVNFASSIGATLAFLSSRLLFRDWIERRFASQLGPVSRGFERDGAFYLLTLRLIPLFPFFVINLVMGLTRIRVRTFYLVSQVGMLPGAIVYVNAGTQLGQVTSLSGILSPTLLASFAALGLFPLAAKTLVRRLQARRVYRGFSKPKRTDYNLVVIGAGSGGLVSAYIGTTVKAKVALVERSKMGGDCLNTGCVPSKALLRSAKLIADARRAREFGLQSAEMCFDFADVMQRVQDVIARIEPHDSAARYTKLGVEVVPGNARIVNPWVVEVDDGSHRRQLTTQSIIVATGAVPLVPAIPGLDQAGYLTSDNLWQLRELPTRLAIIGAGPIGCELAQCFARFGSSVTLIEQAARILPREDEPASRAVEQQLASEGVRVLTEHRVARVEATESGSRLIGEGTCSERSVDCDRILVAVGRRANVSGFGLEELGVRISQAGTIEANEFMASNFPNIFACGDVAGPYQFTHTASHQAWYATVNALFGSLKRFRVDYRVIPWTTFTDPEVATVGLTEQTARERGVKYEVTRYGIDDLDRAIVDGAAKGFVRVLTAPGKDQILGVTIVGAHAGELLAEFVLAMKHRIGLRKLMATIHAYPTLAEANRFAASEWAKAHAPSGLLNWAERFHAWRRR